MISMFFVGACGSGIDTGEGKKIGQIVKIGQHGMFCSTYEAEIIRGGLNGGSGVNGSSLHFTIKDKKLANQLEKAMEEQQEIELSYKQGKFTGFCYGETNIFATGFKILNKTEQQNQNGNISDPIVNNNEIQK